MENKSHLLGALDSLFCFTFEEESFDLAVIIAEARILLLSEGYFEHNKSA